MYAGLAACLFSIPSHIIVFSLAFSFPQETSSVVKLSAVFLKQIARLAVGRGFFAAHLSACWWKTISFLQSVFLSRYLVCEVEEKVPQMVDFLQTQARGHKCIVYFLTCACVDYWGTVLPRLPGLKKLPIVALHGRMKQVGESAWGMFLYKWIVLNFCSRSS